MVPCRRTSCIIVSSYFVSFAEIKEKSCFLLRISVLLLEVTFVETCLLCHGCLSFIEGDNLACMAQHDFFQVSSLLWMQKLENLSAAIVNVSVGWFYKLMCLEFSLGWASIYVKRVVRFPVHPSKNLQKYDLWTIPLTYQFTSKFLDFEVCSEWAKEAQELFFSIKVKTDDNWAEYCDICNLLC